MYEKLGLISTMLLVNSNFSRLNMCFLLAKILCYCTPSILMPLMLLFTASLKSCSGKLRVCCP